MFNTAGKRCELCKKGYEGNALKRTCSKIASNQSLTKCENFLDLLKFNLSKLNNCKNNISILVIAIEGINQEINAKQSPIHLGSSALLSVYLMFLVVLILVIYLCLKFKNGSETFSKKINPCKLAANLTSYLSQKTRERRVQFLFYIYLLCPNTYKQHNSASSSRRGEPLNVDDDRLNLAEYQVFEDNNNNISILNQTNENPYCTLTIKT